MQELTLGINQHIVQLAPPVPPPAFVGIANSDSSHDSVAGVGAAGATEATRAERMFEKESIGWERFENLDGVKGEGCGCG